MSIRLALLGTALCVQAASAQTYVLVVSGVGGEPQYTDLFRRWGTEVVDAARRLGVPGANVTFLAEHPERDARISGPAAASQL